MKRTKHPPIKNIVTKASLRSVAAKAKVPPKKRKEERDYFREKLSVKGVEIQDPRAELTRRHFLPILPLAGGP